MRIGFDVAGTPAEFSWHGATGRVELRVGDDAVLLESPSGSPPRTTGLSEPSTCGMPEMLDTLSSW